MHLYLDHLNIDLPRFGALTSSIYFRLTGFQSSLLLIYFRDGPNRCCSHCTKVEHKNLSDIRRSTFEISAEVPSHNLRRHNRSTVDYRDILVGSVIGQIISNCHNGRSSAYIHRVLK